MHFDAKIWEFFPYHISAAMGSKYHYRRHNFFLRLCLLQTTAFRGFLRLTQWQIVCLQSVFAYLLFPVLIPIELKCSIKRGRSSVLSEIVTRQKENNIYSILGVPSLLASVYSLYTFQLLNFYVESFEMFFAKRLTNKGDIIRAFIHLFMRLTSNITKKSRMLTAL